jgi:MipA family protein
MRSSFLTSTQSAVLASGLFAIAVMHAAPTAAQAKDKKNENPWSVSAGLFVVSSPEYMGGKKNVTSALPDFNLSYRTDGWGTFGIGSKSRGASWTIIDKEEYSFGIALGGDAGRTEKDGTAFRPGSKRLRGMGEIKSTAEFGVFGHVVAGIPISLQVMKGSGNGKPEGANLTTKGHGGVHATLGTEIPLKLSDQITLSVSANLSWADKKYTQTYFGVTPAQSARSGFRPFTTKAGLTSADVGLALNYQFDKNWSAIAGVTYSQLQGDAGKSPIVQKKGQPSALLGVNYTF